MTKTQIFKQAWRIAKEAAFSFDCSSRVFFTEALKQAHSQSKTHCQISKHEWSFNALNGFIQIITPDNKIIKITKYIVRTRTQHSKFILNLAKKSVAFLTEDEIALLINLSTIKF